MGKLKMLTLQAAKDAIEPIVTGPIHDLNPELWEEIRSQYMAEMRELAEHGQRVLIGKAISLTFKQKASGPTQTRLISSLTALTSKSSSTL